jgi:hypothetical protein
MSNSLYPVTQQVPGSTGRTTPGPAPVNAVPRIDAFSNLPELKTIRIDLTAAQGDVEYIIAGNFFWVYTASDTTANANVTFGFKNSKSNQLNIRAGFQLKGVEFGKITINSSAFTPAGRYIEIMYGSIDNFAAFATENSAFVFNEILTKSPPVLLTTTDLSITATTQALLLSENLSRVEAFISNNGSSDIRVGDVNTGASRGVKVTPGATVIITSSAALYAYNTGAAAVTVGITETRNQ